MKGEETMFGGKGRHAHHPEDDELGRSLVFFYSQSTNPGLMSFKCHGIVYCRGLVHVLYYMFAGKSQCLKTP